MRTKGVMVDHWGLWDSTKCLQRACGVVCMLEACVTSSLRFATMLFLDLHEEPRMQNSPPIHVGTY